MKEIHWLGDSLEMLRGFARPVRQQFGVNLYLLQMGIAPTDTKPVKTVSRGVRELRVSNRGQFRLIYVLKKADGIYVLHAFRKRTQKTSTRDIRLARQRYKEI